MPDMKKILFITGTRADFGKLKALIRTTEDSGLFEPYIYVTGMHLLATFGYTYYEVLKERYKNTYVAFGTSVTQDMAGNLGTAVNMLTGYVQHIPPDMIIVHGDRTDALAGAIVGAFNNICVAHIEGGEVSGTIDESTRHAVSKFAHLHLVCNESAKTRLIQMGEEPDRIFILGSPDIDIMLSDKLPTLAEARKRYDIHFDKYAILIYHPVTTEADNLGKDIACILSAAQKSGQNYIVVYPNNDFGFEQILNAYKELPGDNRFRVIPSLRFEHFLTLLKNADFIIGNSSAGIREACIYGIPSIDIGSRQKGRYSDEIMKNIQHVDCGEEAILRAVSGVDACRVKGSYYGDGHSAERFMNIITTPRLWNLQLQKQFVDLGLPETEPR